MNDPTIDALPSGGSQTQKTSSSSVLVNLAADTARLDPTDAGFVKSPCHALLCRVILINPSTRVFTYLSRLRQIPPHGFSCKNLWNRVLARSVSAPAAFRVFGLRVGEAAYLIQDGAAGLKSPDVGWLIQLGSRRWSSWCAGRAACECRDLPACDLARVASHKATCLSGRD